MGGVYVAEFVVPGRGQSQSIVLVRQNVLEAVEDRIVGMERCCEIRVLFLLRDLIELEE